MKRMITIIIPVILSVFGLHAASAQMNEVEPKASDGSDGDNFGFSVSIYSDFMSSSGQVWN